MNARRSIRGRWRSMAVLIAVAAMLAVCILPACATDYTFTNCGQTGRTGPTQTQANAAYSGTSLEGLVTVTSGIQYWTVPSTGTYAIKAYGAQGGKQTYSLGYAGGKGAYIQGNFELTSGEIIKIIVGQKGEDTRLQVNNAAPGGGGGSFVYRSASDAYPLVAAGGGGSGARCNSGASNIQEGNSATSGHDSGSLSNGGSNGNGGITNKDGSSYWAGSGSGWLTDGTGGNNPTNYDYNDGSCGAEGGRAPRNGGYGGIRWDDGSDEGGDGGFGGGGGGGSCNMGGGGGGGYSGGGGARYDMCGNEPGGGGGSYNGGINQVNAAGENTGHGYVTIAIESTLPEITSFAPPTQVSNTAGSTRTFNITVDQIVNVTWYINGTNVQDTNTSVTAANYTNTSAKIGVWNVSAVAENANGRDMQTWIWNVTAAPTYAMASRMAWIFFPASVDCFHRHLCT